MRSIESMENRDVILVGHGGQEPARQDETKRAEALLEGIDTRIYLTLSANLS